MQCLRAAKLVEALPVERGHPFAVRPALPTSADEIDVATAGKLVVELPGGVLEGFGDAGGRWRIDAAGWARAFFARSRFERRSGQAPEHVDEAIRLKEVRVDQERTK